MRTDEQREITKRAKKLMQGLLVTQSIADGPHREARWLDCRLAAARELVAEGSSNSVARRLVDSARS